MVSGRWSGFGALGYSDPVRRPYSERFYHWLIDTVSVKKSFFEKSRFLAYLRWSILIFFIWSVYYTLKNLYHAFVATVDRLENRRKVPNKSSTPDGEELVDALEISFDETTKSASTPYNTGRFCADPFKRQIHELMKQYKKDAKKDIKTKLISPSIKKDDRSYEEREDDEDEEDDDDDDGDSANEETIKERATEESTISTVSSTFLRSDQGSHHECPLCNMPLRIVEIIFDERTSYPEDPSTGDPNSLRFSTDNPRPILADQGQTTICLIGSFTGWSTKIAMPKIISITKIDKRKTMDIIDSNLDAETVAVKLMLPKGHHEFKFLKNDKKFLNSNYGKCRPLNREDQFNFIDVE